MTLKGSRGYLWFGFLLHESRPIFSFYLSLVLACSFSPGQFKHGRLLEQLQLLLLIVHVKATFIALGIWKGMVFTRFPLHGIHIFSKFYRQQVLWILLPTSGRLVDEEVSSTPMANRKHKNMYRSHDFALDGCKLIGISLHCTFQIPVLDLAQFVNISYPACQQIPAQILDLWQQ